MAGDGADVVRHGRAARRGRPPSPWDRAGPQRVAAPSVVRRRIADAAERVGSRHASPLPDAASASRRSTDAAAVVDRSRRRHPRAARRGPSVGRPRWPPGPGARPARVPTPRDVATAQPVRATSPPGRWRLHRSRSGGPAAAPSAVADLSGATCPGPDLAARTWTRLARRRGPGAAPTSPARTSRRPPRPGPCRGAVLRGCTLIRTDLTRADLSGADLSRSFLVKTWLDGADLPGRLAGRLDRSTGRSSWSAPRRPAATPLAECAPGQAAASPTRSAERASLGGPASPLDLTSSTAARLAPGHRPASSGRGGPARVAAHAEDGAPWRPTRRWPR